MPGGADPVQPGGGLDPVDLAGDEVADEVVDAGQVAVVDLAVAHLPDLDQGRLLGRGLLAHGELGEHHVGGVAAQTARPGDVAHRGADVTGARPDESSSSPIRSARSIVAVISRVSAAGARDGSAGWAAGRHHAPVWRSRVLAGAARVSGRRPSGCR